MTGAELLRLMGKCRAVGLPEKGRRVAAWPVSVLIQDFNISDC